jgi:hypothetical protein
VKSKTITKGETWVVEKTTELDELTIEEGGEIAAPEGKVVELVYEGIGREPGPGYYIGRVVLAVAEPHTIPPSCIFRDSGRDNHLHAAVSVKNGKLKKNQSLSPVVWRGDITDGCAKGVKITSSSRTQTGIVVDGAGDYKIEGADIYFEGMGENDFEGKGAGILTTGDTKVSIKNSKIQLNAVTRCAIHAGGNSKVKVENCHIVNDSPEPGMKPAWVMGLDGTNRLVQLCDSAEIEYRRCYLKGTGWGICSIDGPIDYVKILLKDCEMELSGPRARGYGIFVFGACKATFDNTKANVHGYPILQCGEGLMNSSAGNISKVTGGSVLNSTLYGINVFRDTNGVVKIDKKSVINADRAAIVIKGSNTKIDIDDAQLHSKQGVLLQLMDNDEPGCFADHFPVPVGEVDKPIEGRDLTAYDAENDVRLNISNTQLKGDFLNSTTNLMANCRVKPGAHFTLSTDDLNDMAEEFDAEALMADAAINQGVKNLVINLKKAGIEGVVSAATQKYMDGLLRIEDDETKYQLSNVKQTPAPAVNNGVILTLDKDSKWKVTGKSYLTKLVIAKGAKVTAKKMTVNGVNTPLASGTFTGHIIIE